MNENFFDSINIKPENIHIPSGDWAEEEIESRCKEYEEMIADCGGIDIQILGIGRTGAYRFQRAGIGIERESRTRLVYLDKKTRSGCRQ